MPSPHSSIALCYKITSLLNIWEIQGKVFTVALDNTDANDVFFDLLWDHLGLNLSLVNGGQFLHVRCGAHILNLTVQEDLKRIDSSVDKIRDFVKYVKDNQARKQKFIESVTQTSLILRNILRKRFLLDGTYLMLSSSMYYRRVFNHLRLVDNNCTHFPSNDE